ncbi:hypothetical protein [Allorhodopirellula solitaria]|nr:hypothetical protein [Allorhodopirellula solitaria]
MGTYFQYINDSKRQLLSIDPTGQEIKQYAIGRNIGSRLLHLLLLDDPDGQTGIERHPFLGSWIDDRVYVGGDEYTPGFDRICQEYEDIGQHLIELLAINAPEDLHHYGGSEWLVSLARGDAAFRLSADSCRSVLRYLRGVKRHFPSDEVDDLIEMFRSQADTPSDTSGGG